MHIAASDNSLTERHACTCKQIPLPESLHEKLGYAQSRTTKDGGNLCTSSHSVSGCGGWKWLTALVKSQGQGGPSGVSFALFLLLLLWKVHISFKPNSYIKAESHCVLCRQTWEAACLELPGCYLASWEDGVLLSPAHWPAFVFGHIVSSLFPFSFCFT